MMKSKVVMTYFMFVLLRPRRDDREQFQIKEGRSVDFHAILMKKPLEQACSGGSTRRLVRKYVYRMDVLLLSLHE